MKRLLFFFLLFCIQLAGANLFARSTAVDSYSQVSNNNTHSSLHFKSFGTKHSLEVDKHAGLPGESSYIAADDDEDENDDSVNKHVLIARYFLAFSSFFLLPAGDGVLSNPASFKRHLSFPVSCKYIVERTLKI